MISSETGKQQFVIASVVQALAVPFYFLANSHVKAIRSRVDEDDVTLVENLDYSLTGAGDEAGGTLTLLGSANLAVADRITVKRNIPLTQETSYAPNDRFPASSHERALDKLTMEMQQVSEVASRSLVFGEGELPGGNVLPGATARADKLLGFDANGNLDLTVGLDAIRTIIIANPVDELTDVTDYGSVSDVVTSVADYGSIV